MASIAPSFVTVNPSYMEPGILFPVSQQSGYLDLLATGEPLARLSEDDLYVNIRRLDVRTRVAAGQAAYNSLPSISTVASHISTPSYLLRVRGEYDHHDTAAMSRMGVSIVESQRLGMQQGHFNLARQAGLYGMNPASGEGIINTPGATAVNLPADSNGNTTIVTYDNGQMAIFLLAQIQALKTRTNQMGTERKFTIIGPQRTLGAFEMQNIVQLTQFQRAGAGSATTAQVVRDVLNGLNDEILWVYDDTLIGKGAGGTDAIVINMPEFKQQKNRRNSTNVFATIAPGLEACALQYCDMAAPREIPTPIPGGGIDVLTEWRITSGWGIRPETITIISAQYQ